MKKVQVFEPVSPVDGQFCGGGKILPVCGEYQALFPIVPGGIDQIETDPVKEKPAGL